MSCETFVTAGFEVDSPDVVYTEDEITSQYVYERCVVEKSGGKCVVKPLKEHYTFKTARKVPKVGMLLVGIGGNNGTTLTASLMANRKGLEWRTKEGTVKSNYVGSLTQASTVRLGSNSDGESVHIPFKDLLPTVDPNNIVVGGWDISSMPLGDAMRRAKVLDYDLQQQVYDDMQKIVPLPSVHWNDFIAANQGGRVDNVLSGTKQEQLDRVRGDIREFKSKHGLDKVIICWTANTERFADIQVSARMLPQASRSDR
jgi:myo-inositol-1-phosphate synthase